MEVEGEEDEMCFEKGIGNKVGENSMHCKIWCWHLEFEQQHQNMVLKMLPLTLDRKFQ